MEKMLSVGGFLVFDTALAEGCVSIGVTLVDKYGRFDGRFFDN